MQSSLRLQFKLSLPGAAADAVDVCGGCGPDGEASGMATLGTENAVWLRVHNDPYHGPPSLSWRN